MNPTKNEFAVLLFGMPRFYAKNLNSIKTHFSLETFDIDFYAHFWDKIGNIPEDDIKNNLSNVKLPYLHYRMIKHLNMKNINVESYSNLEELSKIYPKIFHQGDNFRDTGYNGTCLNAQSYRTWLYVLGQQYSTQQVSTAALKSGIDYNFYILTRTDLFFKPYSEEVETFYKCINNFFKRNVEKPALLVYNLNGVNKKTFELVLDKKDIINPLTYKEKIKFNDWFIVANKLGLECIFKNRLSNFNFLLSKYAVDSISYKKNSPEHENFKKIFSPQFFLGEACKLHNIYLADLDNHTKGGLPCMKIVSKDQKKQKLSDLNSKRRIFCDIYPNMLEQYNNKK
jgi:hypothetical protein